MHLKWYDQNAFIEIVKNDANLSKEIFLPIPFGNNFMKVTRGLHASHPTERIFNFLLPF